MGQIFGGYLKPRTSSRYQNDQNGVMATFSLHIGTRYFLDSAASLWGNPDLASYESQHDMIFNSRQCKDPCLTPASGLWIHPGRQHTNVSGMDKHDKHTRPMIYIIFCGT